MKELDRSVILVGMMGAGKSTIGRRLARKLGVPFIDSDHEIELAAGRSINEIFADFGEDEFRNGERRVMQRLVDGGPCVLATGGGSFLNAETRQLIKDGCITVWLNAKLDTLVERTSRKNTRPLLNNGDPISSGDVEEDQAGARGPARPRVPHRQSHIRVPNRPGAGSWEARRRREASREGEAAPR